MISFVPQTLTLCDSIYTNRIRSLLSLTINVMSSLSSPVLLAAVLFAVVWSITEDECLPGGNLFGITVLFICAVIGGKLVALIHLPKIPPLPPLLGKAPNSVVVLALAK